jgi:serine/threonine-protein kinase HipA
MKRHAPVFRWMFDPVKQSRMACRVGELVQKNGRWEFSYDASYLALGSQAWALDPAFLKTKQRSPFTRVGSTPPPVFCDIALSGWSRDALQARASQFLHGSSKPDEPWGWWERLIYAPADGFGALFVGEPDEKPNLDAALHEAWSAMIHRPFASLAIETSSGAMGGERPKFAAFRSDSTDPNAPPVPVVLKFALPSERPDSVVAEATALTLAKGLGLRVPRHQVQWFNDLPALCIDRFDREPGLAGPVHHCVSAATALDLVEGSDVDDPRRSYVLLRSRLKQTGDPLELYKRMVLNAVVGNSDDHPWNTSLRQLGLGAWELSPLYDVLPFFHRAGIPVSRMSITRARARAASRANLIIAGREIAGLDTAPADQVIGDTIAYVQTHWRAIFQEHAASADHTVADDWARVFEFK